MNPSFKVWWLIIVGCVALHLSDWGTAVVLAVYALAEYFEQWQAKKARERAFEDVMDGWEQSKGDTEYEEKGNLSRVRLVGQNQIIAARIADLLSRMP
jgi:hypothetical protein